MPKKKKKSKRTKLRNRRKTSYKLSTHRRDRRRLIGLGAAGLIVAIGGGLVYHLSGPDEEKSEESPDNRWDFIFDPEYKFASTDLYHISRNTTRIGEHRTLTRGISDAQQLVNQHSPYIQAVLDQNGWERKDVDFVVSRELRAVPLDTRHVGNMLDYCRTAEEFLHDNIEGLLQDRVVWTHVETRGNYETGLHQKGLLCEKQVQIIRIKIKHTSGYSQETGSVGIVKGSSARVSSVPGGFDLGEWNLLLGRDELIINAPFSEIVPLSAYRAKNNYMLQLLREGSDAYDEADKSLEAMSEGISHVLAKKLITELGIPNGLETIERTNTETNNAQNNQSYLYVPQAIAWVERNGVQEAFDLYMESPAKFMETIRRS